MSHDESSLSDGMRAFLRTAAGFRSTGDDWASRRAAFARQCAHFTPAPPRALTVTDQALGGVTTRCYRPAGPAPLDGWPVLVFFHGGGWTHGSHATHDWFAHALLERADLAIVAVDYRLAPEASFPAPLDDGLAVWHALEAAAPALHLNAARRAVAGDSAGGTLAAALCVALHECGEPQPAAQALIYPVLSARDDFPSIAEHAGAPMLTARGLADSIALYLPNPGERRLGCAMPLDGDDLPGLAPALLVVAMEDVLRDQALDYAAKLRRAGVAAEVWRAHGLVHAGLRAARLEESAACYDRLASFLIEHGVAGRA
ncbi:MAG: alpha/beta hydrolase [Burkholderia gladioli]